MTQILLVDCNNFFVSCEEVFDPALKGLPVCVLSNNDGCVVARSNSAKDLGITMGMPYFIARKKFKNAIFLSGNREKYRKISEQIMRRLYDFTPQVEVYSIDEAFLDITGCQKVHKTSYIEIAKKVKAKIAEEVGIEVSVGLSGSKTLAKLASEIAKSKVRKKTDMSGVFEISGFNRDEILENTSINEIWGIGRNLNKTLRSHNIRSAADFTRLPDDFLKRNLGKNGVELKQELLGNSVNPVSSEFRAPKSISETASFAEFTTDKSFVKNTLNTHCHSVCAKLRRYGLNARQLIIMLRTKDFRVFTNKVSFETPIESEFEVNQTIYRMFDEIFTEGVVYRSSGVILAGIEAKKDVQLGLFDDKSREKGKKLSQAWDNIEKKYGKGSLKMGAAKEREM